MKSAFWIMLFACIASAVVLLALAVISFVRIQAQADLSADARMAAMVRHVFMPLVAACVLLFVPPWLPTGLPKRDQPRPVETETATVITLREPNIDLSITLTGDAANDREGRWKIGQVMQHYGSGSGTMEDEIIVQGGAV